MNEGEARLVEEQIREEAHRVALALADYPAFALDIRDLLGETTGDLATRDDLDAFYTIGGHGDLTNDPTEPTYRRWRRLGELKIALDGLSGRRATDF